MFLSSISLIISNLIPLVGVLILNWSIYPILIAYWIENIIVGYFTYIKIPLLKGTNTNKSILSLFHIPNMPEKMIVDRFLRDYSLFCIVHGVLLFIFLFWGVKFEFSFLFSVLLMVVSTFLSHWISYKSNFLGNNEYLKISPSQQIIMPYSRIMIMHLVVLMGGLVIESNGYKLVAVVFLIILKTAMDLGSHLLEHKNG